MEGDETALCSALSNPSNRTASIEVAAQATTVSASVVGAADIVEMAANLVESAGMQCNMNAVLKSNKSNVVEVEKENKVSGVCGVTEVWRAPLDDDFFFVNTEKFKFRKKALNAARFAQIAFLLTSIFLTSWFLYNVWNKRTARMALLRQEHKPPELVEEELLTERLYTDPPEFPYDDHAPKAAPTYWVEHRSLQPVKMHAGPPPECA